MSQRINASIGCPHCKTQYQAELFRTIWGEDPQKKAMVFSDQINRTKCPACGRISFARTSLLYSNTNLHFAVWFEPEYDSLIDADNVNFKAMSDLKGPGYTYLFKAPRVADWQAFKELITRYERRELISESQLFRENPVPVRQRELPRPSIFKRFFGGSSQMPRVLSVPEWRLVVPQLNRELKEVRVAWYQKCVAELSEVNPGIIRRLSLDGDGEFCSDIYQILLAWYFVTANAYIRSNEIPLFAMEMQAHLFTNFGPQRVLETSQRYWSDGREAVTDYLNFSRDLGLFMVGTANEDHALALCGNIACFIAWLTKATYLMVARVFADQTSVNRLMQDIEALGRQKDVDYDDPNTYQFWRR
jgi:hypothetical protein